MKLNKLFIIPFIALSFGVVGCSNTTNTTTETPNSEEIKNVSITEIQEAIKESKLLAVEPIMETPAIEHFIFSEIKDDIEDGVVIQAMMNVRLQDVVIVKTSDVESTYKALELYKESNLRVFGDGYGGEENIEAFANSILNKKGDIVYFIATPNASEIESVILDYL